MGIVRLGVQGSVYRMLATTGCSSVVPVGSGLRCLQWPFALGPSSPGHAILPLRQQVCLCVLALSAVASSGSMSESGSARRDAGSQVATAHTDAIDAIHVCAAKHLVSLSGDLVGALGIPYGCPRWQHMNWTKYILCSGMCAELA